MRRLVLAVALAILLTGCSALPFGGPPPSDEQAVEAVAQVNDAIATVETYRFELTMRVSATKGDRSRTVTVDGAGSVDIPAKQMHATSQAQGETLDSYVDGYTAYQECAPPWGGWGGENVSQSQPWVTTTPLFNQLTLFERTNVYWRGNRTLNGNRTVLVVAHPDKQTLESLAERRQTGDTGIGSASLKNATARLWIDPETDRPVKSSLRLKLSKGGANAVAHLTIRYRQYGEPVNISIPDSVSENQREMGCPGA